MEKKNFFSYSWHIDDKETEMTVIRIYGLDENNKNVCVTVSDFTPYVYVELPTDITWNDISASVLIEKINERMGETQPVYSKLMFKHKLFYANYTYINNTLERKKFPFLFIACYNTKDINKLSGILRRPMRISKLSSNELRFKVHENNASPILQLTSLRNIPTAGWIQFIGKRISEDDKQTYCDYEYKVSWKNLSEYKSDIVAKPYIMSFDIECNSSDPKTMPNAERHDDKVFQISCVFQRQGENNRENILLTLGSPLQEIVGNDTEIREYDTESELLEGYTDLIIEKQPNIIIGYNIFGFDIKYMLARATNLLSYPHFVSQGMFKNRMAKEKEVKWSSSAYKNQSFIFLDTEGRIFIDILPVVQRDMKLSSYSLKNVANEVFPHDENLKKDPLTAKGIFKCYRLGLQKNEQGRKALGIVGKYCVKDSILVLALFEVRTTWIALCEMSKVCNVPILYLFTQGQQLKVFSQIYKKCTLENIVVERDGYINTEGHYTGATVYPPKPGVYDKVVPFDFSSLYPTTMIAYNICYSTLVIDENIPDSLCHVMEWDEHIGCPHDPKQIRKAELTNILEKYTDKMKELRYQRDLKKNKDRKEEFKEQIALLIKQSKPYRDERSQIQKSKSKHITCCKRKFRWLKEPKGVMPEVLIHLLDTRKATKKEMKNVEKQMKEVKNSNPTLYDSLSIYRDVLDQRQLALKISANSAYGSMGTVKGYLPFMPGAMSTTYKGRMAIEQAAKTIQTDHKGVLIYGDTDSNYVAFPHLKTAQECWDHAISVANSVSKLFPPPMSLAFEEKIYWRFFILTKKRYMSLACKQDGILEQDEKGNFVINKKGVLLQRRDNCSLIRKIYADVILRIFQNDNFDIMTYNILTELNKLCSGFYSYDNFIVTKSIQNTGDLYEPPIEHTIDNKVVYKMGDYKVKLLPESKSAREKQYKLKGCDSYDCTCDNFLCETCHQYYLRSLPAQVQLGEKMRDRGQLVSAGSRIEYVITTNGGHLAKQYTKLEDANYFSKHRTVLKIDYLYYLKQLANPLDQVLNIIFETKDFTLSQYKLRVQKQKVMDSIKKIFEPEIIFKEKLKK